MKKEIVTELRKANVQYTEISSIILFVENHDALIIDTETGYYIQIRQRVGVHCKTALEVIRMLTEYRYYFNWQKDGF